MSDTDMCSETDLDDEKLRAEVSKLVAETGEIKMKILLAPFLAAAVVIGATAAVTAAAINFGG